ncbi:MAG: hypothetical protein ABII07_04095 [Patescibacteria group bacterium]
MVMQGKDWNKEVGTWRDEREAGERHVKNTERLDFYQKFADQRNILDEEIWDKSEAEIAEAYKSAGLKTLDDLKGRNLAERKIVKGETLYTILMGYLESKNEVLSSFPWMMKQPEVDGKLFNIDHIEEGGKVSIKDGKLTLTGRDGTVYARDISIKPSAEAPSTQPREVGAVDEKSAVGSQQQVVSDTAAEKDTWTKDVEESTATVGDVTQAEEAVSQVESTPVVVQSDTDAVDTRVAEQPEADTQAVTAATQDGEEAAARDTDETVVEQLVAPESVESIESLKKGVEDEVERLLGIFLLKSKRITIENIPDAHGVRISIRCKRKTKRRFLTNRFNVNLDITSVTDSYSEILKGISTLYSPLWEDFFDKFKGAFGFTEKECAQLDRLIRGAEEPEEQPSAEVASEATQPVEPPVVIPPPVVREEAVETAIPQFSMTQATAEEREKLESGGFDVVEHNGKYCVDVRGWSNGATNDRRLAAEQGLARSIFAELPLNSAYQLSMAGNTLRLGINGKSHVATVKLDIGENFLPVYIKFTDEDPFYPVSQDGVSFENAVLNFFGEKSKEAAAVASETPAVDLDALRRGDFEFVEHNGSYCFETQGAASTHAEQIQAAEAGMAHRLEDALKEKLQEYDIQRAGDTVVVFLSNTRHADKYRIKAKLQGPLNENPNLYYMGFDFELVVNQKIRPSERIGASITTGGFYGSVADVISDKIRGGSEEGG